MTEVHEINPNTGGVVITSSNECTLQTFANNSQSNDPEPIYLVVPKPPTSIEHGQTVIIISELNRCFALRNTDCCRAFQEIVDSLWGIEMNSLENAVQEGQLVLCTCPDYKLCRAVVSNITDTGTIADVQLLDYHSTQTVRISSLKNITKNLAKYPPTFFTSPVLNRFAKNEFGKEAKTLINTCIRNKTEFLFQSIDTDCFDLKFSQNGRLLSDELVELDLQLERGTIILSIDRTFYDEMSFLRVELGRDLYQCFYKNPIDITLIPVNEETVNDMNAVVLKDCPVGGAYEPEINEMCLGFLEGEWYRCVITNMHADVYTTQFVDFGDVEILKSDEIRMFPRNLKNIPILGIKCKLVGLSNIQEILHSFKELVSSGGIVNVDVKKMIEPNRYEVEIPEIYEKLRH